MRSSSKVPPDSPGDSKGDTISMFGYGGFRVLMAAVYDRGYRPRLGCLRPASKGI
ncbi:hypothetical protein LBMAG15_12980 [Actinomycetes bacterium]|nr:hypothetical protein LBMAG15_12980 [Actinomycetes bacterium]